MQRGRSPARITPDLFAHIIRQFRDSDKFARLANNTRIGYAYVLRLAEHPDTLGSLTTAEIGPIHVQAFLDGLDDRPAIQRRALIALKSLEAWAINVRRQFLPHSITIGTEIVGSSGAREPWSETDIALAEEHAYPALANAITLAANTGQRIGDLCALRWVSFRIYRDRLGIDLTQQKTKLPLWVPLTLELDRAMATWPRDSLFVLTRPNGAPWTRPELSEAWYRERMRNRALEPLEAKKLSLHGLRATAVIRLRRAGVSRLLIQDMVGMSATMVDRYCRRSEQPDNAIAALEQMERTRGEQAQIIPLRKREAD